MVQILKKKVITAKQQNSRRGKQELQQIKKEELIVLIPQPRWKSAHIHQLMGKAQTYLTEL